jgi:hypothetical protein
MAFAHALENASMERDASCARMDAVHQDYSA